MTVSENGLFSGPESFGPIGVEGYASPFEGGERGRFDQVGPAYFSAVGIPLLLGREFSPQDAANSPAVAVINESMARFYFPNQNPIGKRIFWLPRKRMPLEIVGMCSNVKDHSVRWGDVRRFYVPFYQPIEPISVANFEVRTAGNPAAVIGAAARDQCG